MKSKIAKSKRSKNAMRLSCATCNKVFESLVIDKVMAWNECYTELMQHTIKRHPEVMAQLQVDLQKTMVSVSAYVSVSRLAVIPEDEAYINLLLDEFQKEIMNAAGFDEAEEDDIEDDDGEEEGEENGDTEEEDDEEEEEDDVTIEEPSETPATEPAPAPAIDPSTEPVDEIVVT